MKVALNREKELETVGVLALACLLADFVFHVKYGIHAAAILLVIGLFVKSVSGWLTKAWLTLGMAIGEVVSRIVLSLVFYLILTPIALLYRLFNPKKTMTVSSEKNSYFIDRRHKYGKADLMKPW